MQCKKIASHMTLCMTLHASLDTITMIAQHEGMMNVCEHVLK